MKIAIAGGVRLHALLPLLERRAHNDAAFLGLGSAAAPATSIALGLHERGHDLVVIGLQVGLAAGKRFTGERISVHVGPYRPRHRARDLFKVERAYIRSVLEQEQPDIVHANWSYENALGALATDLPVLVTVRDWAPKVLRLYADPYRAARFVMNAWTLARARHLTAPSPYIATKVHRWLRRPVRVVPNALDDADFTPGPRPCPTAPNTLVAMNNGFSKLKNVTCLLKAFSIVRQKLPGTRLHLIGPDYEEGGSADQWAQRHALSGGVSFEGPVPYGSVSTALRGADVFVHPSLEESFGTVVVQAMAQGVPVVAGRRSGAIPWVLADGEAGLLVDVQSPKALAGGIVSLLNDAVLWRQLARAGFERAHGSFRASIAINRYLEAYADVLS